MRLQNTLQALRNHFKIKRRNQQPKKRSRRLQLEQLETRVVPTGTWQALSNLAPQGVGSMILLSNGSVLTVDGGTAWSVLTPDSSGSYVNGTWSVVASSNVARTFFGSAVLPDGRVMVLGGEYSSVGGDTNTGEIYDPVANTWTPIANYPESHFGDGNLSVLPNGNVLAGACCSGNAFIYNPETDTWTFAATTLNGDGFSEEGWVKLAESGSGNGFALGSGNLLDYQIGGSQHQSAVRYDPASNTWNQESSSPVTLDTNGGNNGIVPELGPSVLLPDGQVFWIGATNHTALYTPSTNFWAAGPDTPNDANGNQVGGFDAPAAVEPNGKVLYAASPISGNPFGPGPTTIYEYDPSADTITAVPDTNGPDLSRGAFVSRMLVLPSGQVLFTNSGTQIWAYNPDSGPAPSWAPTVTNLSSFFGTETLTGTQLNGLSEGASYGDDAQMASNYPIIKLTDNNGTVRYGRTFNWSDTGVATGSALVTTRFTMPGGAPNANLLNVIANGIPSANILMVTGTGGNDTITLDTFSFFGFNFITVNVDGNTSSWFAPSVSAVYVDTGDGNDTVNVNDTWAGIPTNINSGMGIDTISIGKGGSVQGIAGNVTIENTPSTDVVNIDDSADGTARTTTLQTVAIANDADFDSDNFGQVSGLAPGVISYEYFDTNTVDINTGTAIGNVINVLASGTTTNLVGNATTTVNIGNAGSVQGILGTLNIENPPSFDTINVDDSADGTARTTTLGTFTPPGDSDFGFISGLAPANINYEYNDTSSVTINTGSAFGNVVNLLATGVTTNLVSNAFTTVNVGNAGSVQGILGPLNIDNPPDFNSITVDDSADATARTTFLGTFTPSSDSNWGFISGLAPANINYEYFDTASVTIKTGNVSGNVVNVLATGVTTNILSQHLSTVNIGSNAPSLGGTLANIAGAVNVSSSSLTTLVVDDSGDTTGQTATITNNSISGTWSPAAISYADVNLLSIHGGSGLNTFNVLSTSATTHIIANPAFSTAGAAVNVGNAGSVQGILGALNIENPPSYNTIVVDDSADPTARTVTLSSGTNGNDSEGNIDPYGFITGLAPAAISYEYFDTTSVTINGGTSGNTFNVQATAALSGLGDHTTTLNTGSGNDTVNVGTSSNSLDNIQGTLTVNGQGGTNTLNVNDQGSSGANTYNVTSSQVERTGAAFSAPINYSGLATLVLNGSSGDSTYNVNSTLFGVSYTFNAGAGNDTFNMAPASEFMDNVQGAISVNGGGGTNSLTIFDQNDPFSGDTYTVTSTTVGRNFSALITYSGMASLLINGSSTANITYNINSSAFSTPVTVLAGAGNNTFDIGTGNLDTLAGAVTVNGGGGTNTVNVNDTTKTGVQTYIVTATTVTRGLPFAGLTYGSIQTLVLTGGTGADIYNIRSTAAGTATTVNGGIGNDTFNVGDLANTLNGIQGALIVNGHGGANTVNVHDQGQPSDSFTLSSTVLSRVLPSAVSITYGTIKTLNISAGGNDSLTVLSPVPTTTTNFNGGGGNNALTGANVTNTWTITGTNTGTLGKINFSNVQNLTGGSANDTFKFSGAGANITGNLNGGGGTVDKLDYSLDGGLAISVNLQTGVASRIGGTFSNIGSLVGSTATTDTLTGANTTNLWSITGLNIGKVNTFSYSAIKNLVGGTGLDTFKFSAAGQESNITGGGAPVGQGDWLDYSSFTAATPVNVNLLLGTASHVSGSISGIENVIGGAGADILTGDNSGNILIEHGGAGTINGGTGRSLLISATGAATVNGGSGGDIMIGGKTSYDTTDHLALMIILAEWRNTVDSYATRTDKISDGIIPGHPGIKLFVGSGGTVTLNPASALEHLNGLESTTDLDWFFASSPTQHSTLETVGGVTEVVNNAS